jgi:hypothetical protein
MLFQPPDDFADWAQLGDYRVIADGDTWHVFESELCFFVRWLVAQSGQKPPEGMVAPIRDPANRPLVREFDARLEPYGKTRDIKRDFDTELILLDDIFIKTNVDSTGHLTLVTDLDLCSSCQTVVDVFRELRPKITIDLVYAQTYPR